MRNQDTDGAFRLPRWVAPVTIGVTGVVAVLVVALWIAGSDLGIAAVQTIFTVLAFGAAVLAALFAYSQYREWAAENHRDATIDFWLEIGHTEEGIDCRLPEVAHEEHLPAEPMFVLARTSAVVRAVVEVHDRFPLRNCTVNVVVPSGWDIAPVRETSSHRSAAVVTSNSRVNPDAEQNHRVRFTIRTGDMSPRSYAVAEVRITDLGAEPRRPFRIMAELSCTPAPASVDDQFRFALLAPHDYVSTKNLESVDASDGSGPGCVGGSGP